MNVDQNEFFREVTLRICSSLDIRVAVKSCYEYIKTVMAVDKIFLSIHDDELAAIRVIASEPEETELELNSIIPIPEHLWQFSKEITKPVINDAFNRNPMVQEMGVFTKNRGNSSLIIPLHLDNHKVGTLALRSFGVGVYSEEHVKLISCVMEPFTVALSNALAHEELLSYKDRLVDDNRFLQNELAGTAADNIIGARSGLRNVMEMVKQVAPINNTVLLLGETGVGKEVIANAIHYGSPRKNGPFIKVNCGAIPETLIDSELFGHEKGAFTGASGVKRGRFERSNGGTIFLDEIGELPLPAQVRLLRVLQTRELERVGGTKSIPVDIRVIAATHRNLEEMISNGLFREDLWFRLNVYPVYIPPLRQRKDDIPAIARYFIQSKSKEIGLRTVPPVAAGALERLANYAWPGNVRELQNVIERELIRFKGGFLTFESMAGAMPDRYAPQIQENFVPVELDRHVALYIKDVLRYTKGRINGKGGAADILGLNPSTLRSKMEKLGISRTE